MKYFILISSLVVLVSCEIQYGMLDNSIEADHFSIEIFEEQAANAPSGYGISLTEFMRDYLVSRSKMKLKADEADIQISGKIKSYYTEPGAIQADENSALNNLKVVVNVSVVNNTDEKQSFVKDFARFSTYPATSALADVEQELLEDINEQISQDLLTELSKNW